MDGLKQSLENAIRQMQETPVAVQSGQPLEQKLPKEQKHLAASQGETSDVRRDEAPSPSQPESLRPTSTAPLSHVPAANSIEAALASAPSVSPHYVLPKARSTPPPPPVPSAPAVAVNAPVVRDMPILSTTQNPVERKIVAERAHGQQVDFKKYDRGDEKPGANVDLMHNRQKQKMVEPDTSGKDRQGLNEQQNQQQNQRRQHVSRGKDGAGEDISRALGHHVAALPVKIPTNSADLKEVTGIDLSDGLGGDDLVIGDKKLTGTVWRWTTIGISCVGGLASGWLGSNVSDQAGGMFNSNVQTIVGKVSEPVGRPIASVLHKSAQNGQPYYVSGIKTGVMTGKTDRAKPQDDNLCTVLELDRGTGLTLAKPCKPVKTAEFNSTLGKADLLVKPR